MTRSSQVKKYAIKIKHSLEYQCQKVQQQWTVFIIGPTRKYWHSIPQGSHHHSISFFIIWYCKNITAKAHFGNMSQSAIIMSNCFSLLMLLFKHLQWNDQIFNLFTIHMALYPQLKDFQFSFPLQTLSHTFLISISDQVHQVMLYM